MFYIGRDIQTSSSPTALAVSRDISNQSRLLRTPRSNLTWNGSGDLPSLWAALEESSQMTMMHLCDGICMKLLQMTDLHIEAIQRCTMRGKHAITQNLQQDTQSQMTLFRKGITLRCYTTGHWNCCMEETLTYFCQTYEEPLKRAHCVDKGSEISVYLGNATIPDRWSHPCLNSTKKLYPEVFKSPNAELLNWCWSTLPHKPYSKWNWKMSAEFGRATVICHPHFHLK